MNLTSNGTGQNENVIVGPGVETAQWIDRYVPESFGLREAVRASKYRWCVRESAMWGIATGTAMTLHRFRMSSRKQFAVNVGFTAVMTVYFGSYYFCVKRRDNQEKLISLMMRLNSFDPAEEMPKQRPIDEHHPFVAPLANTNTTATNTNNNNTNTPPTTSGVAPTKQYVAKLPERKNWQKQLPIQQELAQLFQEGQEQPQSSSDQKKP
jgi:Protein of unknown function (DUF3767)